MDDPEETGSSPWSSFGYDAALNRVYVGTGNSEYAGGLGSAVLPDQRYGSGMIALDATTGAFKGFHVGAPDDSYHANDTDVDVPGSPVVFVRGGQRVVCYGSKNGSVFLLDANTMQVLGGGAQRRQLLAREGGSGHPGNRGNAIPAVATSGASIAENKWGVMATPAIHTGLGKIFVGLGGYMGARGGTITPFIRALDWNTLDDAWPTVVAPGNVTKYSLAQPPVYSHDNEAALSSPAVVNDVVFVSTTDPANSRMRLYALDAETGLCLWASPIVAGGGWPNYALGPAISGEYVVAGAGNAVYIYTRPSTPWCLHLVWPFPWDRLQAAIDRP
jgi:outer membrane protein assembly factor BamB